MTLAYKGMVAAPHALAGWCEAHDAYGRLPLWRLLEAAIDYASAWS
jgi:gamma-glutamyltranspeptidase